MSFVGEGENIELNFSFFESPLESARPQSCVALRLSAESPVQLRALSCWPQALSVPLLGARTPQSYLKSESCWTFRTLTKHAPASTEPTLRPLPWTEGEICQKHIKIVPSALQERAAGAQRSVRRAPESPPGGRMAETPPEEYSGTLVVPKCAEPTRWMVSLRNAR